MHRASVAIAAGLLLAGAAPAWAAPTGGAAFPPDGGGTEYGAPSVSQPVAALFSVSPSALTEGTLPQVRFQVDEGGVPSVRVRLAIVPLARGGGPAISLPLGSFAPGRVLSVTWPQRVRLVAGRYLVRLHVVDPLGRTLLRAAGSSGRQTLTVRPAPPGHRPAPAPAPVTDAPSGPTSGSTSVPAGPSAPGAPSSPTAGLTSGVFPVRGPHSYGDPFGAPRNGYAHQGQDVLAAEGTQVVAPTAGTVAYVGYQARAAGYWVLEHSDDGRDFFFAHCQAASTAVSQGQAVAAGSPLCRVGHTGDATGPHLHFEIWIGGWHQGAGQPIDPLPQLERWASGSR